MRRIFVQRSLLGLHSLRLLSPTERWRVAFFVAALVLGASLIRYALLVHRLSHPCEPERVEVERWLPPHACIPVVYEDGIDYERDSCSGMRYLPMLYDQARADRDIWRPGCDRKGQRIPRLLHLIDLGLGATESAGDSQPLSPGRASQVETFRAANPGWNFVVWRHAEVLELVRDFFPTFVNPVSENGILLAKYLILFKFGGLYLDWDFKARSSLDPLLHHYAVLSTQSELQEPPSNPAAAAAAYLKQPSPRALMSAPGHPLMLHCLAAIQQVSTAIAGGTLPPQSPPELDSAVLLTAVRRHENFQPQTRNPSRTAYVASVGQIAVQLPGVGSQGDWEPRLLAILTDLRARRCNDLGARSRRSGLADFCRRANDTAAYLASVRAAQSVAMIELMEPATESDDHSRAGGHRSTIALGGFTGRQMMQLVRDRNLWKFFPSYSPRNEDYDLLQIGKAWKWA